MTMHKKMEELTYKQKEAIEELARISQEKFKGKVEPYYVKQILAKNMADDYVNNRKCGNDKQKRAIAYVQAQALINHKYPMYDRKENPVYHGVTVPKEAYPEMADFDEREEFVKKICRDAIEKGEICPP